MAILILLGICLLQLLQGSLSTDIDNDNAIGSSHKQFPPFGRSMREEFLFAPGFVSLNHGAYGTYPKYVQSALHAFQARSEANSDLWIRRDARVELDAVRAQLAELVGAAAEDIVMIPNTTSGMNAIFRSMVFEFGDRILHLSTIYNAMLSLIHFVSDYSNGAVTPLQFTATYPMTNEQLLANFEAFLDANQNSSRPIRIALVDHISSTPSVIMPIERIIPMLQQRNILVLIDGAHAIGQIPLNLTQLAPDYYITNCHKWMYAARGCAMMYIDKRHQGSVHPAHISSNYARPSRLQDEFFWTGTMDYSSYMTVTAALDFRRQVGGEDAIRAYTHSLAINGGRYLANQFGTNILQEENQIGNMVDVRLPIADPENELLTGDFWIDTLLYNYPVYASPFKHNGQWWVRISAQIYNDMDDFQTAANAFIDICNNVNTNYTEIYKHNKLY